MLVHRSCVSYGNAHVQVEVLILSQKCTSHCGLFVFLTEIQNSFLGFCISYRNTNVIFGILYFLQKYKCHFLGFVFLTEIQMSFLGFVFLTEIQMSFLGFCISYRNTNVIFGVLYFLQKYKYHCWRVCIFFT
jgi:hypothetical protein